jgi:hypothetical protein
VFLDTNVENEGYKFPFVAKCIFLAADDTGIQLERKRSNDERILNHLLL